MITWIKHFASVKNVFFFWKWCKIWKIILIMNWTDYKLSLSDCINVSIDTKSCYVTCLKAIKRFVCIFVSSRIVFFFTQPPKRCPLECPWVTLFTCCHGNGTVTFPYDNIQVCRSYWWAKNDCTFRKLSLSWKVLHIQYTMSEILCKWLNQDLKLSKTLGMFELTSSLFVVIMLMLAGSWLELVSKMCSVLRDVTHQGTTGDHRILIR